MKSRSALHFVLIIGVANFFADFTYEGARGIVGPFLGSLGASAAVVGFVAGLGELMGYGLRSVSGYFADKSHKHWVFAFLGYTINMFAVPALALTRQWPLAASLVISERVGRGNLVAAGVKPARGHLMQRIGEGDAARLVIIAKIPKLASGVSQGGVAQDQRLQGSESGQFLRPSVAERCPTQAQIMELACSAGRNASCSAESPFKV